MPSYGSVYLRDISGNVASLDTSGNLKINVAIGSITATINISGQNIVESVPRFVVGSGLVVPATSGGIAVGASTSSAVVMISFQGSGRVFVGSSGSPPVASGTNDQQRVGFPIYPAFSGNMNATTSFTISNPAFLSIGAENSGQFVFVGIEGT